MADPKVPHGPDALEKLAARVAEAKQERAEREPKGKIDRSGMSAGLRMASEFASAILVGGLLGYGVDTLGFAIWLGAWVCYGNSQFNPGFASIRNSPSCRSKCPKGAGRRRRRRVKQETYRRG
jgi:hypothetical protein